MADYKTAALKAVAATVVGFLMGKVKSYVINPVANMLPSAVQPYTGVMIGFAAGFLLEAFAPDILGDYTDVVYGAIVGAFAADPPATAASSPGQAAAQVVAQALSQPAPVVYMPAPQPAGPILGG